MSKAVAFIPVRGGSKSIPWKNIKPLCGRPLVYWTAAAAAGCESIDEVYVATDSERIASTVESFGLPKVRVIGRSAESASDSASTESAMIEFALAHEFDDIVLVQATSPLLSSEDLDAGFELYRSEGVDSVLSAVEDKRFYWSRDPEAVGSDPLNYDVYARPRRQDFNGCFMENGAFYITTRARLLETGNRVSGTIAVAEMPPETSFEIDEPADWEIIEALLRRRLGGERAIDFSNARLVLTDCDGCLTDAGMYYGEDGAELKKFNTRDGMAFQLLREAGLLTGIITGENSQAALRRAQKLKADYVRIGCKDKLAAVREICAEAGITLQEVVYVGDDINDVELMGAVGYPCCPADARDAAKAVARYVSPVEGGRGVIRDIAEKIL